MMNKLITNLSKKMIIMKWMKRSRMKMMMSKMNMNMLIISQNSLKEFSLSKKIKSLLSSVIINSHPERNLPDKVITRLILILF